MPLVEPKNTVVTNIDFSKMYQWKGFQQAFRIVTSLWLTVFTEDTSLLSKLSLALRVSSSASSSTSVSGPRARFNRSQDTPLFPSIPWRLVPSRTRRSNSLSSNWRALREMFFVWKTKSPNQFVRKIYLYILSWYLQG